MESSRILLIIVLILLLALVSLNLNNLTGKATQEDIGIDITPSEVECTRYDNSKVINILVDSGVHGIDSEYRIYKENGLRVARGHLCKSSICNGVISKNHIIKCDDPSFQSGKYHIEVERKNYDIKVESNMFKISHVS